MSPKSPAPEPLPYAPSGQPSCDTHPRSRRDRGRLERLRSGVLGRLGVGLGGIWGVLGFLTLGLGGCEGEGTGQVSGTLFVRGCADFDPTEPGSHDVPSPLPSYTMDPQYFFAEVEPWARLYPSDDPPGIARLRLRLQKSSHKLERTDGFELFVYDLDGLMRRQEQAILRGEPGLPIIPAPLDQTPVPPPPAPDSTVRAALRLNGTCHYPIVAPQPRGFVRFTEMGSRPGDMLAGEFAVTLEDLRAQREQGTPAPSIDVGGTLTGSFRFPIRTGPAAGAL